MLDATKPRTPRPGNGNAGDTIGKSSAPASSVIAGLQPTSAGYAGAQYNLPLLRGVARWCRATHGDQTLRQLCEASSVQPEWFEDNYHWVSWQTFEGVLAAARALVASDEEFSAITVFDYQRVYWHARLMTWAATPSLVFRAAERLGGYFSTVGRFKVERITQHSARLRWTSPCPESRLLCLARKEGSRLAPTRWGMPAAHVREYKCIAWGDDCCDYEFYFLNRKRPLPALLGGVLGLGVIGAITSAYQLPPPIEWFIPMVGAVVGYLYELRRVERANTATQTDVADSFRDVMADAAEAHHKASALEERLRAAERVAGRDDSRDEGTHAGRAVFRHEGEYWSISWEGTVCRLRDAKGLHYIAQLLRHPGREFHARELVALVADLQPLPPGPSSDRGLQVSTSNDAGPVLDARAKADFKRRLEDLRAEVEEAERYNDPGRVSRAREEMEIITNQLAVAIGLGGRDRVTASDAERARLAVTKRIKAALVKIRQANPALARHLTTAITTGYFCCYAPTVDTLSWLVG
jgi:hypothetical protein